MLSGHKAIRGTGLLYIIIAINSLMNTKRDTHLIRHE